MTSERDIERLLDAWLIDGPSHVADRVIDDVAARIARQPQRPAWRLRPWRSNPMSSLKLATAVAAIVAVAAGSLFVLGPRLQTPGVSPTPTTTAAPSAPGPSPTSGPASPAPSAGPSGSGAAGFACNLDTTCAGPLTAGTHTSSEFVVPIRFRVPDGWVNAADINRTYQLASTTGPGASATIQVLAMVAIADQTATRCDPVPKPGVGHSVDDIVGYVVAHPGLSVSAPKAVTIGGFSGKQIEFTVRPTWGGSCPGFNPGDPKVLLLTDTGSPPKRTLGYSTDTRTRWSVLDVNGQTVIVEVSAPVETAVFDAAAALSQPVVDSIEFLPAS